MMPLSLVSTTCLLLSALCLQIVAGRQATGKKFGAATIPSTGEAWVSIENGVEFQPAAAAASSETQAAALRNSAQQRFLQKSSSYDELFIDGSETYYDDYSQAWRLIGFYIDCKASEDVDQDGDDDANVYGGCQRYLLWAAVSVVL
jgi:hypothetical protein